MAGCKLLYYQKGADDSCSLREGLGIAGTSETGNKPSDVSAVSRVQAWC